MDTKSRYPKVKRATPPPLRPGDEIVVMVKTEVGRVKVTNTGDHSPFEATMLVVAKYVQDTGADGEFSFPGPDGPMEVTVRNVA